MRSYILDMRKTRLLQLRGREFPNGIYLGGKIGSVTVAGHKHNKLVPPEIQLQDGHYKTVMTTKVGLATGWVQTAF